MIAFGHALRRAGSWLGLLGLLVLAGQARAEPAMTPLVLGFYLPGIRDANPTDIRASLQLWVEEIAKPYRLQGEARMYDDMRVLYRDAMQNRVDLVIAPAMELTETFRPEELTQGFSARRRGSDEGLALIVQKSSGLSQFRDLRGKHVLRLSNDRLGQIFLETQCQRETASPCSKLFNLAEEKRDVQSIHRVFFGQADAALVSLGTLHAASELNPQIGARLRVLLEWKAQSLAFGMMTVRSDPAYRDLLLRSAMQASQTVRGVQILELFKTDYMVRAGISDVQPFWNLYHEYQDLTHRKAASRK